MTSPSQQPVWIYVVGSMVVGGGDQILLMHAQASQPAGRQMVILSMMPTRPSSSFGSKLQAMGVEVDYAYSVVDRFFIPLLGLLVLPLSLVIVTWRTLTRSQPAGLKTTPGDSGHSLLSRALGHASLWVRGRRLQRKISAIAQRRTIAGIHVMQAMASIALTGKLTRFPHRKIYTEILTPQSYFNWGHAIQDSFSQYDEFTVPSEMIWDQMTSHFTIDRPHRVIPFSVPVKLTPQATMLHPDRFHIGVAARLSEEKGHRHLLAAMPDILKHFPHARLILAGGGDEMQNLQAQAHSLGIEKQVEFLGRFDPSQLPDIMARIDVYVLPSRTEGMPQSLIEAMAYSKPIVATPVGAVPELIQDDVNGRLVPHADTAALTQRIIELLGDSALRQKLGSQARQTYLDRYEDQKVRALIQQLQMESP